MRAMRASDASDNRSSASSIARQARVMAAMWGVGASRGACCGWVVMIARLAGSAYAGTPLLAADLWGYSCVTRHGVGLTCGPVLPMRQIAAPVRSGHECRGLISPPRAATDGRCQ